MSALAMATRCFCPPGQLRGFVIEPVAEPEPLEQVGGAVALVARIERGRERDVLDRGQRRQQVEVLEDEPDRFLSSRGALGDRELGHVGTVQQALPLGGVIEEPEHVEERRLPGAAGGRRPRRTLPARPRSQQCRAPPPARRLRPGTAWSRRGARRYTSRRRITLPATATPRRRRARRCRSLRASRRRRIPSTTVARIGKRHRLGLGVSDAALGVRDPDRDLVRPRKRSPRSAGRRRRSRPRPRAADEVLSAGRSRLDPSAPATETTTPSSSPVPALPRLASTTTSPSAVVSTVASVTVGLPPAADTGASTSPSGSHRPARASSSDRNAAVTVTSERARRGPRSTTTCRSSPGATSSTTKGRPRRSDPFRYRRRSPRRRSSRPVL